MQARWRDGDLTFLIELAETLLDHFEDKTGGGFFFTSDDHEQLIHRPKPAGDEAIPSGNGVAAQVLLRLGHLLGSTHYLDAAHNTLAALYRDIERYPSMHNALLVAVEEYLHPTQTIVLRGNAEALPAWQARCTQYYAPRRLTLAIPEDAKELPGILAQRTSEGRCDGLCLHRPCLRGAGRQPRRAGGGTIRQRGSTDTRVSLLQVQERPDGRSCLADDDRQAKLKPKLSLKRFANASRPRSWFWVPCCSILMAPISAAMRPVVSQSMLRAMPYSSPAR